MNEQKQDLLSEGELCPEGVENTPNLPNTNTKEAQCSNVQSELIFTVTMEKNTQIFVLKIECHRKAAKLTELHQLHSS